MSSHFLARGEWGQSRKQKAFTLCKYCSATAKTSIRHQQRFRHKLKMQRHRAAVKNVNSMPARPSTAGQLAACPQSLSPVKRIENRPELVPLLQKTQADYRTVAEQKITMGKTPQHDSICSLVSSVFADIPFFLNALYIFCHKPQTPSKHCIFNALNLHHPIIDCPCSIHLNCDL